ncbi:response regulator transcription factor [Mucilaginibacter panaciglaebae]|uniref:Response regulator transcription factor n=1 Tax=Mucilaginibacter panaciglaebae TaxID=502331 RepID=A0ABP7X7C6_9SPHI
MTNVLIAEDHGVVRAGLFQVLTADCDICVIGMAENGQRALELLASGIQTDILLTDLHLGDMSGIELAQKVHLTNPEIKSMILTMETDERYLSEAFRAGIKGFLLKGTSVDELLYGIKKVNQNRFFICTELTERLSKRLTRDNTRRQQAYTAIELSGRETEILELLSDGYTNAEIADKLFTSRRTVEGHRQSLLNKTGVRNTPELIKFAMMQGLLEMPAAN